MLSLSCLLECILLLLPTYRNGRMIGYIDLNISRPHSMKRVVWQHGWLFNHEVVMVDLLSTFALISLRMSGNYKLCTSDSKMLLESDADAMKVCINFNLRLFGAIGKIIDVLSARRSYEALRTTLVRTKPKCLGDFWNVLSPGHNCAQMSVSQLTKHHTPLHFPRST